MRSSKINVPRLIRIASMLGSALLALLVILHYTPDIQTAQQRVDDDENRLRSDETISSALGRMQLERNRLERQWNVVSTYSPQATFLQDLDAVAARRRVTIASTTFKPVQASRGQGSGSKPFLNECPLELSLRGDYRPLLTAIADLSLGSAVVRVDTASISRDGDRLLADVTLALLQPVAPARPSALRPLR